MTGKMIKEFQGDNRWLSNFTPCCVMLDGVTYPSVENAYQAAKTVVAGERVPFTTMTAGQAKRAGRDVTMRSDWDDVKITVMENLTRQKYSVEPLKSKLLMTGDVEIQEGNSWGDTFWGICNGIGENNLGKLIMKVRKELNEAIGKEQVIEAIELLDATSHNADVARGMAMMRGMAIRAYEKLYEVSDE